MLRDLYRFDIRTHHIYELVRKALFYPYACCTRRASLRRSIWIDATKIDLMLLGDPLQPIEKLTFISIQGMFSQHPPGHRFQVQVLNKDHPNTFLGTQMVSQFELPILPN